MATFLRAGQIVEDRGDVVVLELPPGPGLERMLGDAGVFEAVRGALANELGRAVMLEVRATGSAAGASDRRSAPAPSRITPDQVKADQLARLSNSDPALGAAVREWDLELLD